MKLTTVLDKNIGNFMDGIVFFSLIGATFAAALLSMLFFWVIFLWKDNLGFADIAWALAFFLSGIAFYSLSKTPFSIKAIFTLMILIWSGRLVWYLIRRFNADVEDPRYTEMRQTWVKNEGGAVSSRALGVYIIQAVLITFLALPFYLIGSQIGLMWSWYTISAIVLWALSLYGLTVADEQLFQFKSHPENYNKVCDVGLWHYSRHPNYFFEWLIWVSFALFAWPTTWGFTATLAPLFMLLLLTKVSGIPSSEAQALKTKGSVYLEYQKKTSAFVPWFPK